MEFGSDEFLDGILRGIRDKKWTHDLLGRPDHPEPLSFWSDCRRELAQLIYDVERNRNRPENNT